MALLGSPLVRYFDLSDRLVFSNDLGLRGAGTLSESRLFEGHVSVRELQDFPMSILLDFCNRSESHGTASANLLTVADSDIPARPSLRKPSRLRKRGSHTMQGTGRLMSASLSSASLLPAAHARRQALPVRRPQEQTR
jgi:hypothetical protein